MEDRQRPRPVRPARVAAGVAAAAALVAAVAGCSTTTKRVTVATTVHTGVTTPTFGGTTPTAPTVPTIGGDPTPTAPTTPTGPTTDPGGLPTTNNTPRPPDFPDAAEQTLLDKLPALTRRRCTRTDASNRSRGASASLSCDLRDLYNVHTYIEVFPGVPAARREYQRVRTSQGLGTSIGPCTRAGVRPPGETTWRTRGTGVRGRVMCFRSDDRFWFVWTQEDVKALVWASSKRLPSVRKYWIDESDITP